MQSPWLPRMASGWAGLRPARMSGTSWAREKILPCGSVAPAWVTWMGSSSETMLNVRFGAPFGQMPSGRPAKGSGPAPVFASPPLSPSHGAPLWPLGEKGARAPMFGRSRGNAGRPLDGSKRIFGRLPTKVSPGRPPGCASSLRRSGQVEVSSGAPR